MAPAPPPGMPKTNSMPACSRAWAMACGTGVGWLTSDSIGTRAGSLCRYGTAPRAIALARSDISPGRISSAAGRGCEPRPGAAPRGPVADGRLADDLPGLLLQHAAARRTRDRRSAHRVVPGSAQAGLDPPGWVFGPVWTVLCTLMAPAAWLVRP